MTLWQRIFWRTVATTLGMFALVWGSLLVIMGIFGGGISREFAWALLPLGGASVLAILCSGGLLASSLERAAIRLGQALQAAGAGNLAATLPRASRRELSELAATFDDTIRRFQEQTGRLQGDRDRLRSVLNSMVEGVIAVDAEQRITLINSAAGRLFSLREATALGRPVWEMVRNPQLQRWVSDAIGQSDSVGGEVELLGPVPRILVMHVTRFDRGLKPGAVVVAADVTELRRLERIRQEFVANASHELKTPLASIKACVETLLDGAASDEGFRTKFLTTIDEQTDRLDALIKDMLMLARVESELVIREPRPVEVQRVAALCLKRLQQAAERKQISLAAAEGNTPLSVLADEEGLEQILDNLLDNAIKYTNPGGRVTLRWRAVAGEGIIEVEDAGIGIPQNQLPRIFERFYRVDRHRSRDQGGTGLGLAIVKHLVQAVGGTVSVVSRLHEGSTFTVRLRLATPETISR